MQKTEQQQTHTERLGVSESLMLDIIRVTASLLVAAGHLTQAPFSTHWPDRTWLARASVTVFFVLSGFVIRHITCLGQVTLGQYLIDRASRIYSVAIPALILTLCTSALVQYLRPSAYIPWEHTSTYPLLRIIVNLLFLGQMWHVIVTPLLNSPYWSVNYEVIYYLIYGCAYFLKGRTRFYTIVLLAIACGPWILYLMPLWFGGCLAHDLYQQWNRHGTTAKNLNRLFLAATLLLLIFHIGHLDRPFLDNRIDPSNGFLNSFTERLKPLDYIFGLFWTILFLKILFMVRGISVNQSLFPARSIRFIAEGTFPLYLFHLPIYVLAVAFIPYDHSRSLPKVSLFLFTVAISILFGHPANKLKRWLRTRFFRLLGWLDVQPLSSPAPTR